MVRAALAEAIARHAELVTDNALLREDLAALELRLNKAQAGEYVASQGAARAGGASVDPECPF